MFTQSCQNILERPVLGNSDKLAQQVLENQAQAVLRSRQLTAAIHINAMHTASHGNAFDSRRLIFEREREREVSLTTGALLFRFEVLRSDRGSK